MCTLKEAERCILRRKKITDVTIKGLYSYKTHCRVFLCLRVNRAIRGFLHSVQVTQAAKYNCILSMDYEAFPSGIPLATLYVKRPFAGYL